MSSKNGKATIELAKYLWKDRYGKFNFDNTMEERFVLDANGKAIDIGNGQKLQAVPDHVDISDLGIKCNTLHLTAIVDGQEYDKVFRSIETHRISGKHGYPIKNEAIVKAVERYEKAFGAEEVREFVK